jgi:hypothetical protein
MAVNSRVKYSATLAAEAGGWIWSMDCAIASCGVIPRTRSTAGLT